VKFTLKSQMLKMHTSTINALLKMMPNN